MNSGSGPLFIALPTGQRQVELERSPWRMTSAGTSLWFTASIDQPLVRIGHVSGSTPVGDFYFNGGHVGDAPRLGDGFLGHRARMAPWRKTDATLQRDAR
ncbi:MAG TPA: hypothetical protein VF258_07365, partial [Luteolibacter sp.]